MPSAKVITRIDDQSAYVSDSFGVSGFLALASKRGSTETTLVTNQLQLIEDYTVSGKKFSASEHTSMFSALSFLARSNSLFIKRVVPADATTAKVFLGVNTGALDPEEELLDEANTTVGFGFSSDKTKLDNVLGAIEAENPGAWGNSLKIAIQAKKIYGHTDDTFLMEISNTDTLLESMIVSQDEEAVNEFGQSIYIEDVIRKSRNVNWVSDVTWTPTPLVVADHDHTAEVNLTGGYDGSTLPQENDFIAALNDIDNNPSIRIVLNGGVATNGFQSAIAAKCEQLESCFGITTTKLEDETNANWMTAIKNTRLAASIDSSYVSAPIAGWLEVIDPQSGRTTQVSPDGYVAGNLSSMMAKKRWWEILAGVTNGKIANVVGMTRRFSEGQMDELVDSGINPIAWFPGSAPTLWGQKTHTTYTTALDRMNVQLLTMYIRIAAKEFLRNFLFKFNIAPTREQMKGGMNRFAEDIKSEFGVYDFRVVVTASDQDIDNSRVRVTLYLEPVKGIETIIFTQVLKSTGTIGGSK